MLWSEQVIYHLKFWKESLSDDADSPLPYMGECGWDEVSLNIFMKQTFKNLNKDHPCEYCNHLHYISIGGQSAVESKNHKKTETTVDVVDIVTSHLKRQKNILIHD